MADFYIGQIIPFAGNFAMRNFAFCNGQLISISTNTALFSILGTTYGGNGTTTFALPNLQGRFPMHFNSQYPLGAMAGSNSVSLLTQNLPAHSHNLMVSGATGTVASPIGGTIASPTVSIGRESYSPLGTVTSGPTGTAALTSISLTGSNLPVDITPPYLAVNYLICIYGLFPSRN